MNSTARRNRSKPDIAQPSEIVAEGVSRRRNIKREFWRVRRRPEGWWLVEVLGEYRRQPMWLMLAQYDTQDAALAIFNTKARPLPPGISPPSGIRSQAYDLPGSWLAEAKAIREQQAAANHQRLLADFDTASRRKN